MALKTSQVGKGQVGAAQVGSTDTGGGASSWVTSPTSGHTLGAGQVLTATGTGTSWTGSPFSITGGTGTASITAQSTSSSTAGSITLNITVLGTIILSDGVTTATYNGSAIAPLVPTIGTATNNHDGTVTLTFTANADNGGATVTAANATGSLGDNGSSGGSSPITINIATGNRGSAQTWTVTTTNSAGTSTASGSTGTTPTSKPGVPTSPIGTAGNTAVSVAFTPAYTGGLSVTYTATSTPGSITASGSSSPINVTGLTNGTSYTFTVHAANSDGTSTESSASSGVTPSATVTMIRDAPYYAGDTLPGTPSYQPYQIVAGVLTAIGSAVTTGFNAVPNVSGSYRIVSQQTPNGSFGDFAGIAIFTGINTTISRAIALNSPAVTTPTSLVYCEIAPFTTSAVIGTAVAQTLTLSSGAVGSRTFTAGGGTPFSVASNPVGRYIFDAAGTGRAIITARTSDTVVTATVIDAFASTSYSSSGWNLGGPRFANSTVSGTTITAGTMSSTGIIAIPGVQNGFVLLRSDTPDANNGCQVPTDWDGAG